MSDIVENEPELESDCVKEGELYGLLCGRINYIPTECFSVIIIIIIIIVVVIVIIAVQLVDRSQSCSLSMESQSLQHQFGFCFVSVSLCCSFREKCV